MLLLAAGSFVAWKSYGPEGESHSAHNESSEPSLTAETKASEPRIDGLGGDGWGSAGLQSYTNTIGVKSVLIPASS